MNFLKETIKRLMLETPSYFWKLIYFGIALGTIGTGLMAVPELEQFHAIGEKLFIIGLVCGVIAKTAVKDPDKI